VPLEYNTQYYFAISASVTDANGVAFVAWNTSNKDAHTFTTENHELEAPYVTNWSPTDGSTNIAVNNPIVINLNEKVTAVSGTVADKFKVYKYNAQTEFTAVNVSYDGDKKITINPTTTWDYNTQYYIYIVSTLQDLVGNQFDHSWQHDNKSEHEFTTIPGMTVQVYAEKTDAVADNTYLNGWRYRYEVTLNTTDTNMQVQFPTGWLSDSGSIATYPNMRMLINETTGQQIAGLWNEGLITNGQGNIKSYELNTTWAGQLLNGTPAPANIGTLDGDTSLAGRQLIFYVYTRIPTSTPAGIYTASYGIQTSN